ncbi:MAG: hypothetical protein WDO56_03310 [Gammaproteobacteria bacterium]
MVLDEKVDNLRKDVAELRADVRRIDTKIDGVNAGLVEHRLETEKSFAKLRDETKESIAALRNEFTASVGALRLEMKEYFDGHRNDRKALIAWMISTMIGVAGLAFTAAKLFSTP